MHDYGDGMVRTHWNRFEEHDTIGCSALPFPKSDGFDLIHKVMDDIFPTDLMKPCCFVKMKVCVLSNLSFSGALNDYFHLIYGYKQNEKLHILVVTIFVQ